MSHNETKQYGTATKAELIEKVNKFLDHSPGEYFARDVAKILRCKIEPSDDDFIFEYWICARGCSNLFWRQISEDVFMVMQEDEKFHYGTQEDEGSSLYEETPQLNEPITVDLTKYDKDTTEKAINRNGYTLLDENGRYRSIHKQLGEDAKGMIAVYLSGKYR
jgi:hypothetical protein